MGRSLILALAASVATLIALPAMAGELMGVACSTPAPVHCADTGCTNTETADLGNAVEARSGRR